MPINRRDLPLPRRSVPVPTDARSTLDPNARPFHPASRLGLNPFAPPFVPSNLQEHPGGPAGRVSSATSMSPRGTAPQRPSSPSASRTGDALIFPHEPASSQGVVSPPDMGRAPIPLVIADRRTGEPRRVQMETATSGSTLTHRLIADGVEVGNLVVAPVDGAMRVLSIENRKRGDFKGAGTLMMRHAERLSQDAGLEGRLSLRCQDEGAAVFFYKLGLRFDCEEADAKNRAIAAHIAEPEAALPDDVVFLGTMSGRLDDKR